MGLLSRLGQNLDIDKFVVAAFMRQPLLSPRLQNNFDRLVETIRAFFRCNPECAEFRAIETAPRAPVKAPARKDVEQCDLFGQPQRMIKRGERDRRSDPQPPRAGRNLQTHHVHRRTYAERMEVMFGEPHRVVAGAFHYFDSLQRALVHRLDGDAPLGPAEELKHACFHRFVLSCIRGLATNSMASRCLTTDEIPFVRTDGLRRMCHSVLHCESCPRVIGQADRGEDQRRQKNVDYARGGVANVLADIPYHRKVGSDCPSQNTERAKRHDHKHDRQEISGYFCCNTITPGIEVDYFQLKRPAYYDTCQKSRVTKKRPRLAVDTPAINYNRRNPENHAEQDRDFYLTLIGKLLP